MNDRQLKYMLAIAETKNISEAAKRLYISQPSLSAMVAKVEEDLGERLFDRTVTPLRLTYAGECYVRAARNILTIQRDLENEISNIRKGGAGKIIIGCTSATSSTVFVDLIPRFIQQYPQIQIELLEEHRSRIRDLLYDGKVDIVCSPTVFDEPGFDRQTLRSEEMIIMLPANCPVSNRERLTGRPFDCCDFSNLPPLPFVLMKKGHFTRGLQDALLIQEKFSLSSITETDNWLTCIGMVQNNMAATILPLVQNHLTAIRKDVQMFCPHQAITRDLTLYWRKNSVQSALLRKFIDFAAAQLTE